MKNTIKTLLFATLLSAQLALPGAVYAGGHGSGGHGSGSHTTTSSGFKGGFSSQRSAPAPSHSSSDIGFGRSAGSSDSNTASGKTSFGSFSKNSSSDTTKPSNSALNKDIDTSAANARALKTYDARNAANDPARDTTARNAYGQPLPSQQSGNPSVNPPGAQAPIIINNNSGGSSNGWLWFMVGQSMGHHDRVIERTVVTNSDGSQTVAVATPADEYRPSFFMHALRLLFWLMLLSALAWFIYWLATRNAVGTRKNYSLGKD